MIARFRSILGRILGRDASARPAGPTYLPDQHYPDDVYFVGYPKSGTTWLAFLLGNYVSGNRCDWLNSHDLIPDIHFNPAHCASIARPRMIRSHMPFVPEYAKAVCLTRDGRDVAVSYYYYLQRFNRIARDLPFAEFLPRFNAGQIDQFGPWGRHVESWLDATGVSLLAVRYEDMKRDAAGEFRKILAFAGLPIDEARLASAVEASSFERMRALEQKQNEQIQQIATIPFDKSIPFARSGKVGGWKAHFTPETLAEFNRVHAGALRRMCYPLDVTLDATPAAKAA